MEKGRRKQRRPGQRKYILFLAFLYVVKPGYHLIEVVLVEQLGMSMKSSLRKWIGCKQSHKSEVLEAIFWDCQPQDVVIFNMDYTVPKKQSWFLKKITNSALFQYRIWFDELQLMWFNIGWIYCSNNIDRSALFNDNTHDACAEVYGIHSTITSAASWPCEVCSMCKFFHRRHEC